LSAEAESSAARISVVIVTHDHRDAVREALPALRAQLRKQDELIVVDNHSSDGTVVAVRDVAPDATVVEAGANLGFGAGCNSGARAATGELLLFLNPDAVPATGFREAIGRPLVEGRGWAAWQGLVTAAGGNVINTSGGVIHFTGIAWAGDAGEPLTAGGGREAAHPPPEEPTATALKKAATAAQTPATAVKKAAMAAQAGADTVTAAPGEPAFVSGACLAIPREWFQRVGGFAEDFFLYHEDVDLSLRLRLAGGRLGVARNAVVEHDYEFAKGSAKWRHLERNRWATLIRTYPSALLAPLLPALLATELALVPISISGGWFREKVAAWGEVLGSLPRLLRERRAIQATRTIRAGEFARALSPDLKSPYLGGPAGSRVLRAVLRAYWSAVLAALGGSRSPVAPGAGDSGSRAAG